MVERTIRKRLTALLLALSLTLSLSGCALPSVTGLFGQTGGDSSATPQEKAAAEAIARATDELFSEHSSKSGKEETVYILSDANGKANKTIVSNWLKNENGAASVLDRTDLKELENMKSDGSYLQNPDGTITWEASGADIYHQGTTSKPLPLDVNIRYTLDGKEVAPEALSGATGHLKIEVSYVNRESKQVKVNGKQATLYQPFTVLTGTVLDNAKASGVSCTNGEVINSGELTVVVGMAVPGLKDSLSLDTLTTTKDEPLDINLPETLVIEADVKDFSLMSIVSVVSNNALKELKLDDVQSVDDMKDAIGELKDATEELKDGAKKLKKGTKKLKKGGDKLDDGVNKLNKGTKKLDKAVGKLKDGTGKLSKGAKDLAKGTGSLKEGTGKLKSGANQLRDGTSSLKDGVNKLSEGAPALAKGAKDLSSGADALVGAPASSPPARSSWTTAWGRWSLRWSPCRSGWATWRKAYWP